ncbi:hypothetical protein HAX54_013522 [Datura stramonium]|uniref:Uncharacterized protein n=1 Tax=Datura stramonium TaxID=4076 RepID=A0ABS8S1S0_DATST|nr:hypothetical protein [Datura stramonium]
MVGRGSAPTVLQHPPSVAYGGRRESQGLTCETNSERFSSATEQLTRQIEKEVTITARKLTYLRAEHWKSRTGPTKTFNGGDVERELICPTRLTIIAPTVSGIQWFLRQRTQRRRAGRYGELNKQAISLSAMPGISQETLQLRRKGKDIDATIEEGTEVTGTSREQLLSINKYASIRIEGGGTIEEQQRRLLNPP